MTPADAWRPIESARFWAKVARAGENDCWLWKAGKTSRGYGTFTVHGRSIKAHRYAFSVERGAIPAGHFVCHHCDNPGCVNPAHLFLGSPQANVRDMWQKQRALGQRYPGKLSEQGRKNNWSRHQNNPKAKINWRIVSEIRRSGESAREIARRLGLGTSTIYDIRHGRTWRREGAADDGA